MADTTITLPLDDATATTYANASHVDQQKMALLIRVVLQEFTVASHESLAALMDDISTRAEARGLTPEIVEQLLDDDA